jgi:lipopolysaccharide export system permease protein
MYSMRQLEKAIDSLVKENNFMREQYKADIDRQFQFYGLIDTAWDKLPPKDTFNMAGIKTFDQLLPDSVKAQVNQSVKNIAMSTRVSNEGLANILKEKERTLRKHKIEWHRKIVLSLACIILFLIGAPLGSIIRKGGLGTPLIFAIIFFMIFYFTSTTGEKFAKENTLTPFGGMWLATFILLPVGLFLIYKAMHDSQLFNKEFYKKFTRKTARFVSGKS